LKRSQKIRIYPNNCQATILKKHCGCARLAYNVCLAKWNEDYINGVKHNYYSIKLWFNSIKGEEYPFVYEVSKWATEAAIANLDMAFQAMYAKNAEHPTFHKKGVHDSFRIDGSAIKINEMTLSLPKGINLRMSEKLRWEPLKIYNVTISRRGDMWFASLQMEISEETQSRACENQTGAVGIDLGIKAQATLSDGTVYGNIQVEKRFRLRLARAQRNLARKEKKSRNRVKARIKLAKVYYRMSCRRLDNIHKFTSDVCGRYAVVCLEDLNVSGMLANHHLAKSVSDVSFYEIRRQFEYKAREVRYVGTFAPSSKTCSVCGGVQEMPLSERTYRCPCGSVLDRDINAAINILRWATPKVKLVDCVKRRKNLASRQGKKQEKNTGL
jgi:putative transposase